MQYDDIEREIFEMFEETTYQSGAAVLDYHERKNLCLVATSQPKSQEAPTTFVASPQTNARLLYGFALSVMRLMPGITTQSPFTGINLPLLPYQRQILENLLKLLVHANTLLNLTYRMKDKNGIYQSTREDYVNALELMKGLCQIYQEKRTNFEKELIALLFSEYKPTDIFNRKQLETLFGYGKSHIKNIARYLEERGIIKKVSGNRYKGYKYQLVVNEQTELIP